MTELFPRILFFRLQYLIEQNFISTSDVTKDWYYIRCLYKFKGLFDCSQSNIYIYIYPKSPTYYSKESGDEKRLKKLRIHLFVLNV